MRKALWLAILPVLASLIWTTTAPSHAAGASWSITGVRAAGCSENAWQLDVHYAGLVPDGSYVWHTQLTSDGKKYMDEAFVDSHPTSSGDTTWSLYSDFSNAPSKEPGFFPLTPGKAMTVVLTLETAQHDLLSSWTMVARSCDSTALLYNGPTAADPDVDFVGTPADLCPEIQAFTTHGCPILDRTLTIKARYSPRRIAGKLTAANPSLHAGQPVTIWKVRPGPDRLIAQRTTNSLGRFRTRVGKGRYYATAPALVVPGTAAVLADQTATTRVR